MGVEVIHGVRVAEIETRFWSPDIADGELVEEIGEVWVPRDALWTAAFSFDARPLVDDEQADIALVTTIDGVRSNGPAIAAIDKDAWLHSGDFMTGHSVDADHSFGLRVRTVNAAGDGAGQGARFRNLSLKVQYW